jgi:Tfp pilus assembly protein PilP
MKKITLIGLCAFLLPLVASAQEDEVAESTEAVKPRTVEDIYQGAKYRDPFTKVSAKAGGVSAAAVAEWDPADFSIHELDLKGIMRDKTGSFAILTDRLAGVGFVLRGGKLYDFKNNRIEGVTGKINVAQKTVYLITAEKDVQTLRLGEEEEDGESDAG